MGLMGLLFFADDFTPPDGTTKWIAIAAFLLFILDRGLSVFRKLSPRPPIDEQIKHVEKKIGVVEERIMERLANQDEKAEIRVTKIHERINAHGDRIGYIEGKLGIRSVL